MCKLIGRLARAEILGLSCIFLPKYLDVSDFYRTFVPNQAIGLITVYEVKGVLHITTAHICRPGKC